jgi:apolipoprotein D and lipocalin family protein
MEMKVALFLVTLMLIAGYCFSAESLPVTAVDSVDLAKYCGTWYEIARLPNWFQRKCDCNTTAEYILQNDGKIKVINRCQKADSSQIAADGIAHKEENNGSNAKLKVRFAPSWIGWIPFVWGTYWILDLAPDYSYAAVGDPSRKYLWILSRTPQLDSVVCDSIVGRMKVMGFETERLIFTRQDTAIVARKN